MLVHLLGLQLFDDLLNAQDEVNSAHLILSFGAHGLRYFRRAHDRCTICVCSVLFAVL
eukprot:m.495026 g.495026  ORF g.495026 m.495026 type:complete len:58 (+) comp57296_c0_seq2:1024-1197(+)